jgi:hypothetical protein
LLLHKFNATAAPAITDDSGDGYSVGSRWIDTTADKEYVCLDASVGAAAWTETTGGGGGAPTTAKYVTTATDGTLSAEVIIPGLAGSPDIRAGGADDDEFDTTDTSDPMSGWTTLGTPTAHDMNSTWLSHYYVTKAPGGVSLTGIYKAIPSMPFTVTAKLAGDNNSADVQSRAALFVAEATPGKVVTVGKYGLSSMGLAADIWASPTSYTSQHGVVTPTGPPGSPVYLRIIVTSSTDVTFQWSVNGKIWFTLGTASMNPSMTIGSVGLCLDPQSSGATIAAAFDWIRFT